MTLEKCTQVLFWKKERIRKIPNLYTPANMGNFPFQKTLSLIYVKIAHKSAEKTNSKQNRNGMEWKIQNNKTQKISYI